MQSVQMRHPNLSYSLLDSQFLCNMSNLNLTQETAELSSCEAFDLINFFVKDDQRLENPYESDSDFDLLSQLRDHTSSTISDNWSVHSMHGDFGQSSQESFTGDDSRVQSSDDSDSDQSPFSPVSSSSTLSNQSTLTPDSRAKDKKRDKRIRKKPLEAKTLLSQCLLQWLNDNEYNPGAITWLSKKDGMFLITDSPKVASLWGSKKGNKKKMNHEKLSRALRHYYKDGTLIKVPNKKRLCYQFSASAMEKFSLYFA